MNREPICYSQHSHCKYLLKQYLRLSHYWRRHQGLHACQDTYILHWGLAKEFWGLKYLALTAVSYGYRLVWPIHESTQHSLLAVFWHHLPVLYTCCPAPKQSTYSLITSCCQGLECFYLASKSVNWVWKPFQSNRLNQHDWLHSNNNKTSFDCRI